MGPLGWQETLVIFILILVLFGPKELPKVGKTLAKAVGEFRRASNELKDTWHREMANLERETQDIKKESESLAQVTSDYSSDSSYNYDSSYDYGAYGYPESSESSTTTTTDSSTVSASATQDADSTGTAAIEAAEVIPTPVAAEGAVPTSTSSSPVAPAGGTSTS
jgi:TatA/E family protein of Tat protein translocase